MTMALDAYTGNPIKNHASVLEKTVDEQEEMIKSQDRRISEQSRKITQLTAIVCSDHPEVDLCR